MRFAESSFEFINPYVTTDFENNFWINVEINGTLGRDRFMEVLRHISTLYPHDEISSPEIMSDSEIIESLLKVLDHVAIGSFTSGGQQFVIETKRLRPLFHIVSYAVLHKFDSDYINNFILGFRDMLSICISDMELKQHLKEAYANKTYKN